MMIELEGTLVSRDIVQKRFVCDIDKCKGQCCIDGDSGAPLTEDELKIIDRVYDKIMPYLRKKSIKTIEEKGKYVIDFDNEHVTPLINDEECAYVVFEEGIAKCAFEKAFENKVIQFQKPVSCHLYPIRISKLKRYEGVNYDTWHICEPARKLGDETNTPLYKFLKTPLIRKFGKNWYKNLKIIAKELEKGEIFK